MDEFEAAAAGRGIRKVAVFTGTGGKPAAVVAGGQDASHQRPAHAGTGRLVPGSRGAPAGQALRLPDLTGGHWLIGIITLVGNTC